MPVGCATRACRNVGTFRFTTTTVTRHWYVFMISACAIAARSPSTKAPPSPLRPGLSRKTKNDKCSHCAPAVWLWSYVSSACPRHGQTQSAWSSGAAPRQQTSHTSNQGHVSKRRVSHSHGARPERTRPLKQARRPVASPRRNPAPDSLRSRQATIRCSHSMALADSARRGVDRAPRQTKGGRKGRTFTARGRFATDSGIPNLWCCACPCNV